MTLSELKLDLALAYAYEPTPDPLLEPALEEPPASLKSPRLPYFI